MLHNFSFKTNEFTLNEGFEFKIGQWINFEKLSEYQKLWCIYNLPWVTEEGRLQILEGWYSYAIYMDRGTIGFGTALKKKDLKGSEEITFKIFPETKPSIFENPKWVTCCNDSLGQVTLGKDYKVVNVCNDNYTIIMDTGIEGSLHKDRFHKVTYEDLLPEKEVADEEPLS